MVKILITNRAAALPLGRFYIREGVGLRNLERGVGSTGLAHGIAIQIENKILAFCRSAHSTPNADVHGST